MRQDLPAGMVTLVFTDIEGSTRLLEELGSERYGELLSHHHRVCRAAWVQHGGVEVDTTGDAFFVAFQSPSRALAAAAHAQLALAELGLRVRMGVHTGDVSVSETGYVGFEVHRAARIAAAAHGGQVVVSKSTAALVSDHPLVDLGEHRFKDVPEPIAIFQLGEGSFPPLKTISNTNLPRPASSFVGREHELAEVLATFEQGARLVTLTGPGGSGKTRLAIEAAATLVPEYRAGVFWVGLASLRAPALVTETIGKTLGAKNGLAEHIGERELLLLLDNLEQVIDAAPEVSALVRTCPNLRLLATSRELLRIEGEVAYAVPPLAEPDSVALFCERARTEPSNEIRQLCTRLDNLPLAVELAAARTKALSPAQILERVSQRLDLLKGGRDADPRQQTLRATIEWSHDLLHSEERRLFRALSVFAGGCTLEAAEQVADADLDTLQSLVEKNLLRFTNERYWMLETIREFALERLQARDARELLEKHARFYVEFAARNEDQVRSNRAALLDIVEAERPNIAAAVESLAASGDGDAARRLVGCLWLFWFFRGRFREGYSLVDTALAAPPEGDPAARVDALWGSAKFSMFGGDIDQAAATAAVLLELGERHGLSRGVAIATELLAMVEAFRGNDEAARPLYKRSLELARQTGDQFLLASVSNNLGDLELGAGNYETACGLFEESLAVGRATGDDHRISIALTNLGFAQHLLGSSEARSHFAESVRTAASLEYREGLAYALVGLALTEGPARAPTLVGCADAIYEELEMDVSPFERELREQVLTAAESALGTEACGEAFRRGRAMTIEDVARFALGGAVD